VGCLTKNDTTPAIYPHPIILTMVDWFISSMDARAPHHKWRGCRP
jgi:hypothetical protein